jgi:hypothetical protein
MLRGAGVFAGMSIRGAVTAQRDATCLARPQMNPVAADLHAFRAFPALRMFDGFNRVEMRTGPVSHD